MNPISAKLRQVSTKNNTMASGWAMEISTNRVDVAKITVPINSALVAAANFSTNSSWTDFRKGGENQRVAI